MDNLRRPLVSIPRSPGIAEPLFLARYIEKAGTGTLDMISQCALAGLPAPEFRQDGGQFIQTLWRATVADELDGTESLGTKSGTRSGPSRNSRQSQYGRGFDRFDDRGRQNQPAQVQGPSHLTADRTGLAGNDPAQQTHQQSAKIPPHRSGRGVAGQSDRKQEMNMRELIADYLSPFAQEGGMGRVVQLFGTEFPKVLEAMNQELAA